MVNITARINARKIVLSYIYEYCFFYKLKSQENTIKEILFIDNVFVSQEEKFENEKKTFFESIDWYLKSDFDNIYYYVDRFFDKRNKDDIDFSYIEEFNLDLGKYQLEIENLVNQYTKSFSFDQMDSIDQAIFILWYIERKKLKTGKEILLNELIELSKRYADDWSSKLINWIMHNIIS